MIWASRCASVSGLVRTPTGWIGIGSRLERNGFRLARYARRSQKHSSLDIDPAQVRDQTGGRHRR